MRERACKVPGKYFPYPLEAELSKIFLELNLAGKGKYSSERLSVGVKFLGKKSLKDDVGKPSIQG